MKITFGNIKTMCAKAINVNASDDRVIGYVNRAVERLIYEGKWKDTLARYVVCVTNGCLTWPRQIETIEAAAVCEQPYTLRNGWYDFLEQGWGLLDSTTGPWLTMRSLDQTFVAFDDVQGDDKKLAIYADGTETAGSTVLIRYYDSNANKVYTTYNGEVIEGERIVIPAAGGYAYSTYEVMPYGVYDVQKPVTNRPIRLYEYDTVALTYRALAYYEPDETLPEYRRSLIPCFQPNTGGSCESRQVTIIGKLRFIPAVTDDSVIMISHADAIRLGVQAVFKEENNLINEAAQYWQLAERCLQKQLSHFQGDGVVQPLRIVGADQIGGGVLNMI